VGVVVGVSSTGEQGSEASSPRSSTRACIILVCHAKCCAAAPPPPPRRHIYRDGWWCAVWVCGAWVSWGAQLCRMPALAFGFALKPVHSTAFYVAKQHKSGNDNTKYTIQNLIHILRIIHNTRSSESVLFVLFGLTCAPIDIYAYMHKGQYQNRSGNNNTPKFAMYYV
jgi:hypothetical protein